MALLLQHWDSAATAALSNTATTADDSPTTSTAAAPSLAVMTAAGALAL